MDPHERAVLALFTSGKQAVRGTVDAIASFATVAHENGDDDEGEAAPESDAGNFISQLCEYITVFQLDMHSNMR